MALGHDSVDASWASAGGRTASMDPSELPGADWRYSSKTRRAAIVLAPHRKEVVECLFRR